MLPIDLAISQTVNDGYRPTDSILQVMTQPGAGITDSLRELLRKEV